MVTWSPDRSVLFRASQHMKMITFEHLNEANQTLITVFIYVMGKHGVETDTTHVEGAQQVDACLHGKQKRLNLK